MADLKFKAIQGIFWTGASQFLMQIIQFIVSVILARLLFPEDFGLLTLANLFILFLAAFNELGLGAAIIQRSKVEEIHLSTSFWGGVAMGVCLCLITVVSSPFIAIYFQNAQVREILLVISINFVIGAFGIVHSAILVKKLEFKNVAKAEIYATIISGVVAIFLAYTGFGVWSLVSRVLMYTTINVIMLWILCSWRPTIQFDYKKFIELFNFGKNVIGSQVLGYTTSNVDYFFIGKYLGTSQLGFYSVAYNFMVYPTKKVTWVFTKVSFPAFSQAQNDENKMQQGYLKLMKYISTITFPMLAGIFVVADDFVAVVYGARWMPMVSLLKIFCLAGALNSISAVSGSVLWSKGRSDISFKWHLFTAIIMVIAVYAGVNYGIVGVALAVTVARFFLSVLILKIINNMLNLDTRRFLMTIYPASVSSIAMIIGIMLFQKTIRLTTISQEYILAASVVAGILIYIMMIRITSKETFSEAKAILSSLVKPETE